MWVGGREGRARGRTRRKRSLDGRGESEREEWSPEIAEGWRGEGGKEGRKEGRRSRDGV